MFQLINISIPMILVCRISNRHGHTVRIHTMPFFSFFPNIASQLFGIIGMYHHHKLITARSVDFTFISYGKSKTVSRPFYQFITCRMSFGIIYGF